MSATSKLTIDEDNLIEWDEMTDSTDGSFVNTATVTFTIKEADGVTEWNGVVDIAMPYVVASDGKYQGILDKLKAADLVRGRKYYIEITATDGSKDGFRRFVVIAEYHDET